MNMRVLGVTVFASLFVAVGLLAGAAMLAYVRHASEYDGMQPIAAGFGFLAILVPMAIILGVLACFVVVFLAFRSRRR